MLDDNTLLFGLESELALMNTGPTDTLRRKQHCHELLHYLKTRTDWLPDWTESGFFCPWGRVYIDRGCHPELSTSPAADPWMLIHSLNVMESWLLDFAVQTGTRVFLTKCNMDYVNGSSWGSHENYRILTSARQCYEQVIPHLVTRILFSGGGGFRADRASRRVTFCLSPRTEVLCDTQKSPQTPWIGLKPLEPYGSAGRLHIAQGENLNSAWAILLRTGTTALLLALAQQNPPLFTKVPRVLEPLATMRRISRSWWIRQSCPVRTETGWAEPTEIQRHYADLVRVHRELLPAWADFVLDIWTQAIDALEHRPASYRERIDWLLKFDLFENYLRQHGGYTLADLSSHLHTLPRTTIHGLLRLDSDFGQLSENGHFSRIRRDQNLPELPFLPSCDGTDVHYPLRGASKARSDAIRELACKHDAYACSWTGLINRITGITERRWSDQTTEDTRIQRLLQTLDHYVPHEQSTRT